MEVVTRREFLATFGALVLQKPQIYYYQEPLISMEDLPSPFNTILLTIDDGPSSNTEKILMALGNNNVIFYMIGQRIEEKFALACRAVEQGNIIGNHSYTHLKFSRINIDAAKKEIEKTDEAIEKVYKEAGIPRTRKLFRFPYGDSGDGTFANISPPRNQKRIEISDFLQERGYETQFWDCDTDDWKHYSSKFNFSIERVMNNCRKAKDGHVVLCHDNSVTANHIVPFYVSSKLYKLTLNV